MFAAVLAMLVGIGLSRFAYSPLIPAVVEEGWFSPTQAAYLGAANLAGYLIGALFGRRFSSRLTPTNALRLMMMAASLAFVASAVPLSFAWFFFWRLLSGITGGGLMVLAAPTVLPHVPAERRGLASGAIFSGVGVGIILSGTLVPALLAEGLALTWLVLAALSFAATGVAWFCWPADNIGIKPTLKATSGRVLRHPGLLAVYASYGFIALGLVPHMVFFVDFVARGLNEGIAAGGAYWVLFGLGALIGPIISGRLADRFGFGHSLRGILVLHVGSVGLAAFDHSAISLSISALLVGSIVTGAVPLVLGQTQERVHSPELQKSAWGIATAAFALAQAVGGYAYSFLFAATDSNYKLLFTLGAAALVLALLSNLLAARSPLPIHQPVADTASKMTVTHSLERKEP